ncbi:septum site-determining protein MinC [Ramlibacter alkalitolerans]|uniref:Probable septum site-determining protein MinC n=1 Tax=Ramlibacter alkalitolerans TaxID=2039631 RepID=A0ABS1JN24_9BURK|nr:septum site-determining protein MinC [Ramlibacter alkalitolerans]MBL0425652.1 septum site-determining protein MinC [Ramlibacter alkalitolerans]
MTVALAGRTPATFEIKSANLPLVALLLKSSDLQLLEQDLQGRFGEQSEFFDHDPMVIDLAPAGEGEIDFARLVGLLKRYRVMPVAVKSGTPSQMQAALAAGLASAQDAALTPALSRREREEQPAPAQPVAVQAPPASTSALVIDKPLRSGQQVYARGRDVVVLAMVNAGAEVIADGHIHVYAPLRGKAIAGARGDAEARILTLCLEPELVSIAGVYRTSEHPLPDTLRGKPAQIRLEGEKLVMLPLNP